MSLDTPLGPLTSDELEQLCDYNAQRARQYEDVMEDVDPQTAALAEALATWRRERARYFRQQSAAAERAEAEFARSETAALPGLAAGGAKAPGLSRPTTRT